jgi:putative membrane protein
LTPNLTNELAKARNRDAAERTLMAWIRTCLALISFGFGIDKIVGAINRTRLGAEARADMGVRLMATGFVLIGVAALAAAIHQHRLSLRRLTRDDFVYTSERSIATATAVALIGVGLLALVILVAGAFRP